jgi:hypothetical protein
MTIVTAQANDEFQLEYSFLRSSRVNSVPILRAANRGEKQPQQEQMHCLSLARVDGTADANNRKTGTCSVCRRQQSYQRAPAEAPTC